VDGVYQSRVSFIEKRKRLRYYPVMKSRQFQLSRIIDKNAHADAIYLLQQADYITEAWAIVCYLEVGSREPHDGNAQ
jgi:hypothetical protein